MMMKEYAIEKDGSGARQSCGPHNGSDKIKSDSSPILSRARSKHIAA